MQILLLASLVFSSSSQLGFCESGTSEDVSVFREMLQECQERVFERMDNMEREMEERLANIADKVFNCMTSEFLLQVPPLSKMCYLYEQIVYFFRH